MRRDVETDRVEVADPFPAMVTLVGLREALGPTGERDAVVSAGATSRTLGYSERSILVYTSFVPGGPKRK